jgi:hypothetical protein
MEKYNINHLKLQSGEYLLENIHVAKTKDQKGSCCCGKKSKFLFDNYSNLLCAKCIMQKGISSKQIDKVYNFIYSLNNKAKPVTPIIPEKKESSNADLSDLYKKAFIDGDEKALMDFLERFNPLIYKRAKYVNREYDFDDLVSFFRSKVIDYHRRESYLSKNLSDPANLGLLVKCTKEHVMQGVNLMKSRMEASCREGDFAPYLEINECYNLRSKMPSTVEHVHCKEVVTSIKTKVLGQLNHIKYILEQELKEFSQDLKDIDDFIVFMEAKSEPVEQSLLVEKKNLESQIKDIQKDIQENGDVLHIFELLLTGVGCFSGKLNAKEIKAATNYDSPRITAAFKEIRTIMDNADFKHEKHALTLG